jgi:hypothetical protein
LRSQALSALQRSGLQQVERLVMLANMVVEREN